MGKKGEKQPYYSKEFKLQVIQIHFDEHIGSVRLGQRLGIDDSRIRTWIRKFKAYGEAGLDDKRGLKGRPRKQPHTLEEQVKRLSAENAFLKKLLELGRGNVLGR